MLVSVLILIHHKLSPQPNTALKPKAEQTSPRVARSGKVLILPMPVCLKKHVVRQLCATFPLIAAMLQNTHRKDVSTDSAYGQTV